MKARSIPWARISTEFLVIFVGVTLGLAADDWRQGRLDRQAEHELLRELSADLEADSANLQMMLATMIRYDQAALAIRGWLAGDSPTVTAIEDDVRRLMMYSLYQPVSSAYVSLKEGGQMSLIQDVAARRRIVSYYEVTQPYMLQFAERVSAYHEGFRSVALQHLALRFDPTVKSNFPPGDIEFVSSGLEISSDHTFRSSVEELGIVAADWVRAIELALRANAELREGLDQATAS